MSNVERSVVKTPNEALQTLAARRSATPAASAPMVHSPNATLRDGDPSAYGGNPSFAKGASPINLPDHRFSVDRAKMPQPAAADAPGQGAIPVDLRVGDLMASGIAVRDNAKRK